MEHSLRVSRQTIDADILTASSFLRSADGPKCKNVFALGFCFGGRQAFFASAARFGFTGVIGYYGALGLYPNGATGPLQHAAELSAPILGVFGGADHGISGKDVVLQQDTDTALLGGLLVELEGKIYDGSIRTQLENMKQRIARGY